MSETALFVIGFGIFGACFITTLGLVIGTSQPPDADTLPTPPDARPK